MRVDELDTPALIVDLDIMERNLQRMSDYCRRHGLALRPHSKTHKTPELARLQLEGGATGITVAKLGEAEVMAEYGIGDLLLAYPLIGETKIARLHTLLEQTQISVALDSTDAARWLARAADGHLIDVLVEIDLGMRRCGLPPGTEPVRLARFIDSTAGLRFQGILYYSGHVHPDYDGDTRTLEKLKSDLASQLEQFEKEKIPVGRVSGGSTPSAFYSHHISGLTEIRPGTYIFNDRNSTEWKICNPQDCAASILTTVVSVSVPGRAIIDGGSKTFSGDGLMPGEKGGYGMVKNVPGARFVSMNEEHGYLDLEPETKLQVGRRLEVIPNHICAAVNMHEVIYGYRGNRVEAEWRVRARGKIR